MREKLESYMKFLLFNDCYAMHSIGSNHNAMDRSCVRDRFEGTINEENFTELYDDAQNRYLCIKQDFGEGSYDEAQIEAYATQYAKNFMEYREGLRTSIPIPDLCSGNINFENFELKGAK